MQSSVFGESRKHVVSGLLGGFHGPTGELFVEVFNVDESHECPSRRALQIKNKKKNFKTRLDRVDGPGASARDVRMPMRSRKPPNQHDPASVGSIDSSAFVTGLVSAGEN